MDSAEPVNADANIRALCEMRSYKNILLPRGREFHMLCLHPGLACRYGDLLWTAFGYRITSPPTPGVIYVAENDRNPATATVITCRSTSMETKIKNTIDAWTEDKFREGSVEICPYEFAIIAELRGLLASEMSDAAWIVVEFVAKLLARPICDMTPIDGRVDVGQGIGIMIGYDRKG